MEYQTDDDMFLGAVDAIVLSMRWRGSGTTLRRVIRSFGGYLAVVQDVVGGGECDEAG